MKSSFCIDLQRFMLIPTKFPLSRNKDNLSRGKASKTGVVICSKFITFAVTKTTSTAEILAS